VFTLVKTGDPALAASNGNIENMVGGASEALEQGPLGEMALSSVEWLLNRISYTEGKEQKATQQH
jgi:hypothetical protein